MRETYHGELTAIREQIVEMTRLAGSAMQRASTALLDADLTLAESVIARDEDLDKLQRDLDERAYDLLARQQPVASDLRVVVTSLRMSATLERMGDLARHVAKIARLRYPDSAVPVEMRPIAIEMASVATRMAAKVGGALATADVETAMELHSDDDEMDRLHRSLYTALLDGTWKHGMEAAIDLTLIGRYYERFADHAVSLAKREVYLVTGEHVEQGASLTPPAG